MAILSPPVLQQLLADAVSGSIDVVVVIEMERLCRGSDLRDWATITTTFREAGVRVATPERIFNLEAAEDDFDSDLHGILLCPFEFSDRTGEGPEKDLEMDRVDHFKRLADERSPHGT